MDITTECHAYKQVLGHKALIGYDSQRIDESDTFSKSKQDIEPGHDV